MCVCVCTIQCDMANHPCWGPSITTHTQKPSYASDVHLPLPAVLRRPRPKQCNFGAQMLDKLPWESFGWLGFSPTTRSQSKHKLGSPAKPPSRTLVWRNSELLRAYLSNCPKAFINLKKNGHVAMVADSNCTCLK